MKGVEYKVKVFVEVSSPSLSLTDLEKLLGVRSSAGWSKGEEYISTSGEKRIRKFSVWTIEECSNEDNSENILTDKIVKKLVSYKDNFKSLPNDTDIGFCIWHNWHLGDHEFGLHLDNNTLKFLSEINADIDIDTSVLCPEK